MSHVLILDDRERATLTAALHFFWNRSGQDPQAGSPLLDDNEARRLAARIEHTIYGLRYAF